MDFRRDIQGLRGIAVLAVLADHFAPDIRQTAGGFVGVDIFFVISGFLISTLIISELDQNLFTIKNFYIRRVRRIFPSLLTMLLGASAFIWLTSSEFVRYELLTNLLKAATFTSNIGFSSTQDYFAGQTTNPLLHLWSLAVEEQFYLFLPLFFVFFYNSKNKRKLLKLTYLLFCLSFVANLIVVYYFENKSFAFYNSPTRFWELLIGSLLAQHKLLNSKKYWKNFESVQALSSYFGIFLIIVSFFIINEESAFPGYLALLPCIGTLLLINCDPGHLLNRYLLGNSVLVWFGSISYALYLWHFPLLFVMRTLNPLRTNFTLLIVTLIVSILFAFLSTRFIESTFRKSLFYPTRFLALLMAAVLILSFLGRATLIDYKDVNFILDRYTNKGWGNQSNLKCLRFRKEITVRTLKRQGCFNLPNSGEQSVYLIGDSHSGALRSGLKPFLQTRGIELRGISTGWCDWYSVGRISKDKICDEIYDAQIEHFRLAKPEILIIDAYWAKLARQEDLEKVLTSYISFVQSLGVSRVIVIGQVPTYDKGLPHTIQNLYTNRGLPIPLETERTPVENDPLGIDERMKIINYPQGASFVSIDDVLCKFNKCRTLVGSNLATDLIVWDYGHLTKSGAYYLSEKLFNDLIISG